MAKLSVNKKSDIKEEQKDKVQNMANESADKIYSAYTDLAKTMKSSLANLNESVFLDNLLAPVEASAQTVKNIIDSLKLSDDYDDALKQIMNEQEDLHKRLKKIETLTIKFLKDLAKTGDQRKIDIEQIYKSMDTNLKVAEHFTQMVYYDKYSDLQAPLYYALGLNDLEGRSPDKSRAVKVLKKYIKKESESSNPDFKSNESLMPLVWTILALMEPSEALEIVKEISKGLPVDKRSKLAIAGNFYGVFTVKDMATICPEQFKGDKISKDDIVKYSTIYKTQHEVTQIVKHINSNAPSGSTNAASEGLNLFNVGKLVIGVAAGVTFVGNAATRIFAEKAWKDPAAFVKSFFSLKGAASAAIMAGLYMHGKKEQPDEFLKSAAAEDTDLKLKSKRDINNTLRESPGFELFLEGNNHTGVEKFGEWVYSLRYEKKIAKVFLRMDNFYEYLKRKESKTADPEKQKYTELLKQIKKTDQGYQINGYPITDDDILKMASAFNVFEVHSATAVKSYQNGKDYANEQNA